VGSEDDPSLSISGGIATISFNRPSKKNCLRVSDIKILRDMLSKINESGAVQAVIFRSHGDVFCSGFDIGSLINLSESSNPTDDFGFASLCDEIENLAPITVAVMHAPVLGGGVDIGLSCDFRIGTEAVYAQVPAARLGISYYGSGLARYVSRTGLDAAKKLFLLGERMDFDLLKLNGYLTHQCASDDLQSVVDRVCDQVQSNSLMALRTMKTFLNAAAHAKLNIDDANRAFSASIRSDEVAVSTARFLRMR
jgi:enoyl-CoA hydratase/carnithine racemase